MQTYEILVTNRSVKANSEDMTLVRTSVGIDQIHVLFDNAEWLEFPITVTFSSELDSVTKSLLVTDVIGSDEWVAEATTEVPWEVIDETGSIRVTFQGTDQNGRHIITAAGSPLSVEEAGDVDVGEPPEDVPAVDQWNQAYASAVEAANMAASLVSNLQDQLASMVSAAETSIGDIVEETRAPATAEGLGLIQVGFGLDVTDSGVLSVQPGMTMTGPQRLQLANLAILASDCFETSFDEQGVLEEGATVRAEALPIATAAYPGLVMPDGISLKVDSDGLLRLSLSEEDKADIVAEVVRIMSEQGE